MWRQSKVVNFVSPLKSMNEYSCFHGHKKCKIPPRNMGVWSKIKWHVFYGSRCMSIHISSLLRRLDWYRSLSCDIALSYDDICTALCVCSALDVLEECVCDNHLSRNLSVFLFIYSICHFKNCFFLQYCGNQLRYFKQILHA